MKSISNKLLIFHYILVVVIPSLTLYSDADGSGCGR